MAKKTKLVALIPCAGMGSRIGYTTPKQYIKINGSTILEHTISAFLKVKFIDEVVVVVAPNDNFIHDIVGILKEPKIKILRIGGKTRAQTVINGLSYIELNENDWILVHDAARCCIEPNLINEQIESLKNNDVGGILAIPAVDTIKYVENGVIRKTLDRANIYLAQTPQMFRYNVLKTALSTAENLDSITDEASAVEALGVKVKIILGDAKNIKVTNRDDIEKARIILENNKD